MQFLKGANMLLFSRQSLVSFATCALIVILTGCSEKEVNYAQITEQRILDSMNRDVYKQVDAIDFLEEGGLYVDDPDFGDAPFDRPHIVPLLKTLRDDFGFDWTALVSREKKSPRAYDLVARLPPGVSRAQVESRLSEIQTDFPGEILQSWGEEWLSLDFLNAEEAAFLAEDED